MADNYLGNKRHPTAEEAEALKWAGVKNVNNIAIDPETGNYGEILPEPSSNPVGFVARQVASNLVPMATGAITSAGVAAGVPAPPLVKGLLGALGFVGGATAGSYGQEATEQALARRDPSGFLAEQLRQREADQAAHPFYSMATSALAGPLLGIGGLGARSVKDFLKYGAANLGIADAQHMAQKGTLNPLDMDPVEAATAFGVGGLTSRTSPRYNNFLRSKLPGSLATTAIGEHMYPQMDTTTEVTDQNIKKTPAPDDLASNPDKVRLYNELTVDQLEDVAGNITALKALAATRRKVGDLSHEEATWVMQNAKGKRPEDTVAAFLRERAPKTAAEQEALRAANEANAAELAKGDQRAAVVKATEDLVPPPTGLSAEESARAIMGRPSEVKAAGKDLDVVANMAKRQKDLLKIVGSLEEGDPALPKLVAQVAELQGQLEQLKVTQAQQAATKLGASDEPQISQRPNIVPSGITDSGAVPPPIEQAGKPSGGPAPAESAAPTGEQGGTGSLQVGQKLVLPKIGPIEILSKTPIGYRVRNEKGLTFTLTDAQLAGQVSKAAVDVNKAAPAVEPLTKTEDITPAGTIPTDPAAINARLAELNAKEQALAKAKQDEQIARLVEMGLTPEQALEKLTGITPAPERPSGKTVKITKKAAPAPAPEGRTAEAQALIEDYMSEGMTEAQARTMAAKDLQAAKEGQKKSSGIGGGMSAAVEKNQESGSIDLSPLEKPVEKVRALYSKIVKTANTSRGMKIFGSAMYDKAPIETTVKELVQNAFDAVKNTETKNVALTVHPDLQGISLHDSGTGMTPTTIVTKFLPAFESGKDAETSAGGYGLAKIQVLGGADKFQLDTVTDHNGLNLKSTLTGTGEDWINWVDSGSIKIPNNIDKPGSYSLGNNLQLEVRWAPNELPGTTMTVRTKQPFEDYDAYHAFATVARYADPSIKMYQDKSYGEALVMPSHPKVKGYLMDNDIASFAPLKEDKVPGAVVSIKYDPNAPLNRQYSIPVLNNGLQQFRESFREDVKLPPLVIDIRPTAKTTEQEYPYTPNRDALKSHAKVYVERALAELAQEYKQKVHDLYQERTTKNTPITKNQVYMDLSGKLSAETKQAIAQHMDTQLINAVLNDVHSNLFNTFNARYGKDWEQATYKGLAHGGEFYGVRFGTTAKGSKGEIYYDLFHAFKDIDKAISDGKYTPEEYPKALAEHIGGTVLHELAHQINHTEGESHARAMTSLAGIAARDLVRMADNVEKIYAGKHEQLSKYKDWYFDQVKDATTTQDERDAILRQGKGEARRAEQRFSTSESIRPDEVSTRSAVEPTSAFSKPSVVGNEPRAFGFPELPGGKKPGEWLESKIKAVGQILKDSGDPVQERLAKRTEEARVEQAKQEVWQDYLRRGSAGYTPKEKKNVDAWLSAKADGRESGIVLSAREEKLAQVARNIFDELGNQKALPDAAWIKRIAPDGTVYHTPFEKIPDYIDKAQMSDHAREVLSRPDKYAEDYAAMKHDYIVRQMEVGGRSYDDALKLWQQEGKLLQNPGHSVGDVSSPEFAGSRIQRGVGLPDSMRANVFDTLPNYISRHYTDRGYRVLERDTVVAKALGLADNGQGQALPPEVFTESGQLVEPGYLARNPVVADLLRDYTGQVDRRSQSFEHAYRVITRPLIGTLSSIADITRSIGVMSEVAKFSELGEFAPKAVARALSAEGRAAALERGSVRAHRNATPAVDNAMRAMDRIVDGYDKWTGNEGTQKLYKTFVDAMMEQVAGSRIRSGDEAFMRKWGPVEWAEMTKTPEGQKSLQDYITKRMVDSSVGSYNAEELPAWATRGSTSRFLPATLLARWSIGRANRWHQNVIKPLNEGNPAPLVRSLIGGLAISAPLTEWLMEKLKGTKPKELTWAEYFKLGGQDSLYTAMNKADMAGMTGILGQLGAAAVQGMAGEKPYGINNPMFTFFAQNVPIRAMQAMDAVRDGKSVVDVLAQLGIQTAREQLQVFRALSQQPDTGNREEKIARRLGYLKAQPLAPVQLTNPFSKEQEYRRGDTENLTKDFEKDIARGQMPNRPTSQIRNELGVVNGKLQPRAYYEFIKQAQGEEAAAAALARDQAETQRRMQLYGQAMSGVRGRN